MTNTFLSLRQQIIKKEFGRMNDKQLEAVLSTEGPLLVLAGAGSGKTTVLVNRIANIIKYGQAAYSDRIVYQPSDTDIEYMKRYLENDEPMPFDVAQLLPVRPARPWEILAITFTNKAANELKERIIAKLDDGEGSSLGQEIWACTFHSACARILRRHAEALGYTSHFTIYDTDDAQRVIKECQRLLDIDDKFLPKKSILKEISRAKDAMVSPEEYSKETGADIRKVKIAQAYECYQRLLKTADAMDFDDIIYNTVRLLENNEEIRDYYQNRFKYIMIDEYQDTNYAQYLLTTLLAARHKNICVVGDDDQSIYRFRGATIENILNFEDRYENVKTIRLEQNYRSTQNILDAANAVIANNEQRKGKNLWTSNGDGEKIVLHTAEDESDEGRYIANTIINYKTHGGQWKDNAVLYRMNALSNTVENALVRAAIPYRIIGGHRFYERKEIRDAIAYLTVIGNPSDNVRLRRIINEPKRGIGDTTVNNAAEIADGLGVSLFEVISNAENYPSISRAAVKLKAFTAMIDRYIEAAETMPLNELLEYVMKDSGYIASLEADKSTYADRVENIGELSSNLVRYAEETEEPTLNGFLEEVALMTDIDAFNADSDNVVLMTIHSAKGLEFNNVFIVGAEEGVFPGAQSAYDNGELEEERRLAYVGITRAKKRLTLTNTRSRMIFGSTTHNPTSRFVNEIPPHLLEQSGSSFKRRMASGDEIRGMQKKQAPINRGFSTSSKSAPTTQTAATQFSVGDTVKHKAFGQGVILSIKPMGNDQLLEIAFDSAGTKKIMAKFAKLEKI
ncbi:MAG: UvrD-helicase domain-containing protein [Clostridia bacterium]|nr:UvrD-helicase domain-containing protein [Clostridia bacterium]